MLRRVESRGAVETAHRIHQTCGQIFRYGIATSSDGSRNDRDIAADLRGALQSVKAQHHASITEPKAVGELIAALLVNPRLYRAPHAQ